ncbi:MAG: hypothetical protein V2G42_05955 [bacterium JZ-2024 1]
MLYFARLKEIPKAHLLSQIDRTIGATGLQIIVPDTPAFFRGVRRKDSRSWQHFMGDPQVLIVDEPPAGLDPEERSRFRLLLESVGLTRIVTISSHIVENLFLTCDMVTILNQAVILVFCPFEIFIAQFKDRVWGDILPTN